MGWRTQKIMDAAGPQAGEQREERCLKTKEGGGCWTCVGGSDRGPIRAGDDTKTPQLFWDQDQEAFRVSVISSQAGCRRGLFPVGRLMEAKSFSAGK